MVSHSATMAEFMAGKHRDCHPLSAWYSHTPSTEPQTSERVPSGLVPPDRRKILVAPLVELGLEQQMTLYYRREPTAASSWSPGIAATSTPTTSFSLGMSNGRW